MRALHTNTSPSPATKTSRRLLKAGVIVALSAASVGAMGSAAFAAPTDTSTGSTTANAVVESGITMTGLTPSFTLTGTPGATITGLAAVTYNVETNAPGYNVTVEAAAPTFVGTVGNVDTIPVGALTVRDAGTGSYLPVSNSATTNVHFQDVRSADLGDNLASDFQMRMPTVNPDTYSVSINYVASTAL